MQLSIGIVQTFISENISENVASVCKFIVQSNKTQVLLFPEGMISGYYPKNPNYLKNLNKDVLDEAIQKIGSVIQEKHVNAIIPTALSEDGKWFNVSLWFDTNGRVKHVYKKCNLSNLDRNYFLPGNKLETYVVEGVSTAIQMCREIKYPEQWLYLKLQGARVIFHLNNNQDGDSYWENLYKARAYENQYFIVSVNPSHAGQKLFSYIVSPQGKIVLQTENTQKIYYATLDLDSVKNDSIDQRRKTVVDLVYTGI
ncbi:MAG: carbon-nitrogen hydrolase family protein [Candidatus Roizmanbacteria bacterium]|nr:carbon-nitrogen hydrolase family protein [Candidatus Roizmanbacteria bacterium]